MIKVIYQYQVWLPATPVSCNNPGQVVYTCFSVIKFPHRLQESKIKSNPSPGQMFWELTKEDVFPLSYHRFLLYVSFTKASLTVCCIVFSHVLSDGCQYQCMWLSGKMHVRNAVSCVYWGIKHYSLILSLSCILWHWPAGSDAVKWW